MLLIIYQVETYLKYVVVNQHLMAFLRENHFVICAFPLRRRRSFLYRVFQCWYIESVVVSDRDIFWDGEGYNAERYNVGFCGEGVR